MNDDGEGGNRRALTAPSRQDAEPSAILAPVSGGGVGGILGTGIDLVLKHFGIDVGIPIEMMTGLGAAVGGPLGAWWSNYRVAQTLRRRAAHLRRRLSSMTDDPAVSLLHELDDCIAEWSDDLLDNRGFIEEIEDIRLRYRDLAKR